MSSVNQSNAVMPERGGMRNLFEGIKLFFFTSSGTVLLSTATLKALSIILDKKSASLLDPIFMVKNYYVLSIAAIFEIIIGVTIIKSIRDNLKALLIIWLSGNFVLYRMGLQWISWNDSCQCLGSIIKFIPIRAHALDWLSLSLLGYMLFGSIFIYITECFMNAWRNMEV